MILFKTKQYFDNVFINASFLNLLFTFQVYMLKRVVQINGTSLCLVSSSQEQTQLKTTEHSSTFTLLEYPLVCISWQAYKHGVASVLVFPPAFNTIQPNMS